MTVILFQVQLVISQGRPWNERPIDSSLNLSRHHIFDAYANLSNIRNSSWILGSLDWESDWSKVTKQDCLWWD